MFVVTAVVEITPVKTNQVSPKIREQFDLDL